MKLWVLEARGIVAAITLGIYSTQELAIEAAHAIWPTTDGYHDLHIEPFEVDTTYESSSLGGLNSRTTAPIDLTIG